MKFDITIGDFFRILESLKTSLTDETPNAHPLFFFEGEKAIDLFQPVGSVVYHTLYIKGEPFIQGGVELAPENFKLSVLAGAIELIRPPRDVEIRIQ